MGGICLLAVCLFATCSLRALIVCMLNVVCICGLVLG